MLADGLVGRGHDVTLFATASSTTTGRLHAIFQDGYHHDSAMWPWELCELFNLAAAIEHPSMFDLIHYQAEYAPISLAYIRVSPIPLLQTLHHAPTATEVALWSRYSEAPFVAVSQTQAKLMSGLNVVQTIHHAVDPEVFQFSNNPKGYLLFLGRFTEGKGVLEAIDIAKRTDNQLILAAAKNQYYRDRIEPLVDDHSIVYAGEANVTTKLALLQEARTLLYPIQSGESFGLVMAEAMMCGTPVAALDRGAVGELVDEGITGRIFTSLDTLVNGLDGVLALNRAAVRARALKRFAPGRMVDEHINVYRKILSAEQRMERPK
jgi:glycosyltransferase involved in cell wall biosynthesis